MLEPKNISAESLLNFCSLLSFNVTKMIRESEHLCCDERLRDSGEEKVQGHLIVDFQNFRVLYKKDEDSV